MIRAASMPHLGQTTPTAALGLRAMRSLLTRLDAMASLTVLSIPEISATARLCAPVSEDVSFLRGKSVFLLSMRKACKKAPHAFAQPPYICGYDGNSADISVGPSFMTFSEFRADRTPLLLAR